MVLMIVMFVGITVFADEGMWPLYDLDNLPWAELQARGLELDKDQIYNPGKGGLSDAVIQLGATASFVSPEGLIITNHHVAYGAIQRQSTVNQNYLRDGYYADTHDKEIRAIGSEARVTLSIDDVTDRVYGAIGKKMNDKERHDAIEKVIKEIVAETESKGDFQCRVAAMDAGLRYMLYTFLEIKDIRIVYVPPLAIGKFGGEIDNWMWPRHTGDFAFFRAYVGPDGKSAEYSPENVPYHPEVYFPISSKGVVEGDLTLMMGFPGKTNRYATSFEIDNIVNVDFPRSLRGMRDRLDIYEDEAASDSTKAIRLASTMTGIYNYYKKNTGVLKGLERLDALGKAKAREDSLRNFISSNKDLKKKYGDILDQYKKMIDFENATQERDELLGTMRRYCDLYSDALSIYKRAVERDKPDMDRESGYQDRDRARAKRRIRRTQINLLLDVDKRMMRYYIGKILALPKGQKVEAFEKLFPAGGDRDKLIDLYLNDLYARSKMGYLDDRLAMFDMTKSELDKLDDPFIKLAIIMTPVYDKSRERDKEASGMRQRLQPQLISAYREMNGHTDYPDANGTMRLNYASVGGFSPADAVEYFYITSLTGVMEKETGIEPFIVPEELKAVYATKDYDGYLDPVINNVPVNFLTTNDGTNGNSGSPLINGKGELVAIDFDGNIESVADDYIYNGAISRSIVVDMRYMLFLIDKVYHLDALVKELTVH